MNEYDKLADLIFPNITKAIEDLEKMYPKRDLLEGSEITRFAPSPTGFLHTGALFTSLVNRKIADQTKGIFYFRLEDTDTKREILGSAHDLLQQLSEFGINPQEGLIGDGKEIGNYGPYIQSRRKDIYEICAKELIRKGLAYPCFCTADNLNKLRTIQEKEKMRPGYYGRFARCRNNTAKEMIDKINEGNHYVLRLRSGGNHMNKISFSDKIRGKIEQAQNDMDIIIIKSDGLPTYHFAHVVDDHFMRTTLVIRGEEWISSVPLHLELFHILNFKPIKYAHVPTIMKLDGNSKRKLSKRKDPEAACSYFIERGYPAEAIIEYLLTIVNSDFEPWRRQNPNKNISDFEVKLNKINSAGALFDMDKINNISKDIIGNMTTVGLMDKVTKWAENNDRILMDRILQNEKYIKEILGIERDNVVKVRKDFAKYSDIMPSLSYMFDDLFNEDIQNGYDFAENISNGDIKQVLGGYINILDLNEDKDIWFKSLKDFSDKMGFCSNMKEYKQNKDAYKGSIADISGIIRVAITNRQNTPDIYSIMKILGKDRVISRLNKAI